MKSPRPRSIVLAVLGVLVVAAVVLVLAWDWSWFRGPATRAASAALGRQVTVAGDISVDLGMTTRIALDDVAIANAPWGKADRFATAKRVEATIRLSDLIYGRVDIPQLVLVRPKVSLERNAAGEANWTFDNGEKSSGGGGPPAIHKVRIEDGTLSYRDASSDSAIDVGIATADATSGIADGKLTLKGKGRYLGKPFNVSLTAGSIYRIADTAQPFPVDLDLTLGGNTATAKGTITAPLKFSGADFDIDLKGPDLAEPAAVAGYRIPKTPAYALKGQVVHKGNGWSLRDFAARFGKSDLSGTLAFDGGGAGKRPGITGKIVSSRLDPGDFSAFTGSEDAAGKVAPKASADQKSAASAAQPVIPDMDLDIELKGHGLAEPMMVAGYRIPKTPAYGLKGRVVHKGDGWSFNDFAARLGNSDLSGNLAFDGGGASRRPKLTGKIVSNQFDLDDFSTFIESDDTAGKEAPKAGPEQKPAAAAAQPVIPDVDLDIPALRAFDADVSFTIKQIANTPAKLESLDGRVALDAGKLALKDVRLSAGGSSFQGSATLDAASKPATASLDAQMHKLDLGLVLPKGAAKDVSGNLGGSIELKGEGASLAPLLKTLKGRVTLFLGGGKLNALLAHAAGLDVLGTLRNLIGDRKATTRIRCMVADFDVKSGVMQSKALVLDTDSLLLTGNGTISLPKETLNLTLTPRSRGISPLQFSTPLAVFGTFRDPAVAPKATSLGAQAGATLALGLFLGPVAALVPMIQDRLAGNGDCGALLNDARSGGGTSAAPGGGAEKAKPKEAAPAQ